MADVYEFGGIREAQAFWERHARLEQHFYTLIDLTNKCFGREYQPADRAEYVVFDLGQACRDDFNELICLAAHGFGSGAMKLLRGMFERAVTAAYIMENPGKAERFVRFAAIQERRIAKTALEVVSEEEFNNALGPANTARDIEERYQEVKPEFEAIVCSKCGTKRVAASWDHLDVASMAKRVGPPFTDQILGAYSIPNLRIHATLASIRSDRSQQEEADFAFQSAFYLMLTVIGNQNEMYRLNLDDDIASLSERWMAAWRPKPEASGLGETSHDSDR